MKNALLLLCTLAASLFGQQVPEPTTVALGATQPNLTTPLNVAPAAGVLGQLLINKTYLGFGSANTAKTTGAIAITSSTAGHNIYAVGCSGNFATTNWAAAVTDSASNTYFQLGANTGTYPQANSTTQVCVPFLAVNATAATTITFTISGTNSANATVSVMAWDIGNAVPSLAAVDHWAGASFSAATAVSVANGVAPSQNNTLVIAAGCMSTGTMTLGANSGLTFDSGSQAIASGSNIASCFGGSALLPQPLGVIGSFTDGSSAAGSEVIVILRGYGLTDGGLPHVNGSTYPAGQLNPGTGWGVSPVIVAPAGSWCKTSNPGSGVTASAGPGNIIGKQHIVTSFGYAMMGDATGAAATQAFTVADSVGGTFINMNCSELAGVSQPGCSYASGMVNIPASPNASVTAAFGGNTAHALESLYICGYDVDVPNIVY